jgi:spore germination protein YaaH
LIFIKTGEEMIQRKNPQIKQPAKLRENVPSRMFGKLSKFKMKTAKLMMGSLLLTSLCLGAPKIEAADFYMSYLYSGDAKTYIGYVDRTQGVLQAVSPNFFNLNPDGSLKLTTQVDVNFVNEMHKRGVKVVPFLSNHWDRELGRSALLNKDLLSSQIAEAVKQYNLDGVNIDIENVTEQDRNNYTEFVKRLREKVPPTKEVSVAVAANPYGWTRGWHGSYDYIELAKYADYLIIMAYDEHYEGGAEGPVASIDWVEKSIQYALSNQVPREKIVLGIPFYGRYWIEGQSYGGYGIASREVNQLVERYKGKVYFDPASKSVKATLTIHPGDPVPVVGGRTLRPGNYTIWYENNESIKAKLELVNKYNLKGTGSWRLGQEDPTLWLYFKSWMQSSPYFTDIEGNWAKDDILSVAQKGWMVGTAPNRFSPEKLLTRAEAATILVRFLGLTGDGESHAFTDVPFNHWARKEIEIAAQQGIMVGVKEGIFAPDQFITREEMAIILSRILGEENSQNNGLNPFKDVNETDWSYPYILATYQKGIFQGYKDGTFRPKENVARDQMAALMNRISNYMGMKP